MVSLSKNSFQEAQLVTISISLVLLLMILPMILGTSSTNTFAFAATSSISGIDARGVVLVMTHTEPEKVMTHKDFSINSTVLNGSPNKIQVPVVSCNGPLSASFDKGVDLVGTGFCNKMRFKVYDLYPGQSMNVSTKDNLLEKYVPRSTGTTNATLQLLYAQNGTLLSHTQPFVFTIYPCMQGGHFCP